MAMAPWELWDLQTGAPRDDVRTLHIKEVLETALLDRRALSHPGILHLYIHLMELSPTPELALPAADRLRNLVPLIYAEPWGWMQPPRHAYAALQLEQGNVGIAARTYAEDLGYETSLPRAVRHPNNVWALHGYHECLVKLGRTAEASIIKPQLTLALAVADVSIESSCFCRRVQPAANETMCCE
jgi:hypothetical protein